MSSARLRILLVAFGICAVPAQAQERLAGTWRGFWSREGDTLQVLLTVEQDTSGRYSARFTSDRLRVSGIPFQEVALKGCCEVTLVLRGDRTTTRFTGKLRGDSLSGTLQEGARAGRFAYVRVPAERPAFEERAITFPSGAVTLAGSLLLPSTGDSLSAVVFLHGSGPEGRWASRYLAEQLAHRGIAALIFDKRGVGGSSGDWRHATPDDLAADGAAAVSRLREEARIAGTRIGLHGHSQGGTLAPLVAVRSRSVAFVIASAAAGLPTDSTELYSLLNSIYPAASSRADSASAESYASELVAVAYHGRPRARLDSLATAFKDRPWFVPPPPADNSYWSFSRAFARYRALEWWSQVRCPVLLIYGDEDRRVPARESAERIRKTLRQAGNKDVTVSVLPGADHTFRMPPGPSGWPVTAPGYVTSLLDWLAKR